MSSVFYSDPFYACLETIHLHYHPHFQLHFPLLQHFLRQSWTLFHLDKIGCQGNMKDKVYASIAGGHQE